MFWDSDIPTGQREDPGQGGDPAAEAAAGDQVHGVHHLCQPEHVLRRQPGRVRAPLHQKRPDLRHRELRGGRGLWGV